MNREQIIEMAKEAGFVSFNKGGGKIIERFAALVAAAEREKCVDLVPPQYFEIRDRIRARGQQ